jgi:two-component system response regulator HydG
VDRILVVDDEPVVLDVLSDVLEREGFAVTLANRASTALEQLAAASFDLVLSDIRMPGMDGFELLRRVGRSHPGTDVILMTGYASVDGAIDALQLGAADYLMKPLKPKEIVARIRTCLRRRGLEAEVQGLREDMRARFDPKRIVAASPAMASLAANFARVASGDDPVLICGELGSGRRFLAHALHYASPRQTQPSAEIECNRAPPSQAMELLFGRSQGTARRVQGQLERMRRSTLILIDFDRLPAAALGQLSRCLRERTWACDGDPAPRPLETRLVLTCSNDALRKCAEQETEVDLSVVGDLVRLRVPPLRERAEDIPGLVESIAEDLALESGQQVRVASEALELLRTHPFPGNVRQMRFAIGQAASLGSDGVVTRPLLQRALEQGSTEVAPGRMAERLHERERQLVQKAVQRHPRQLDEAARELGISRTTLWRRMRKYGIRISQQPED